MSELNNDLLNSVVSDLEEGKFLVDILKDRNIKSTVREVRKAIVDSKGLSFFQELRKSSIKKNRTARLGRFLDMFKSSDDLTKEELNDIIYKLQDCVIELSARVDEL
jgi:tRNA(Phe) wybutosine-synthesizing methylase Tyw3